MQRGDRVILHSDINCCYASIEHLHHPELAGKPLAVGGDPEARHGIVLTADYIAKKYGVKTGMALWQAKQVCPDITFVSPRMDLYWEQIDLFSSVEKREKQMKMDSAVDEIRKRFGFYSIQRGLMYRDRILSAVNAKEEHTVHPHGYFG